MSLRIENDNKWRSRRETQNAILTCLVKSRIENIYDILRRLYNDQKGDLYALWNYRKWTILTCPFAISQLPEFFGNIPFWLIRLSYEKSELVTTSK